MQKIEKTPLLGKANFEILSKMIESKVIDESNAKSIPAMSREIGINHVTAMKHMPRLVDLQIVLEKKQQAGTQTWSFFHVSELGRFTYLKAILENRKTDEEISEKTLNQILDMFPLIKKNQTKSKISDIGKKEFFINAVENIELKKIMINSVVVLEVTTSIPIFTTNGLFVQSISQTFVPPKFDSILDTVKDFVTFSFFQFILNRMYTIVQDAEMTKTMAGIHDGNKKQWKKIIKTHEENSVRANKFLKNIRDVIQNDDDLKRTVSRIILMMKEITNEVSNQFKFLKEEKKKR